MDKAQRELVTTYYRKRAIAASQSQRYKYRPYEFSKFAIENKILDLSKLNIGEQYEIYNTNVDEKVRQYVLPYIEAYNSNSGGLLRILLNYENSGNAEELFNFIKNSEYGKTNIKDINIVDNYKGHWINIDTDKQAILNATDLEYDYDYVNGYASYYNSNSDVDSSELDYMQNSISAVNMNKIKEIAKIMGATDEVIDSFKDEGKLTEFLAENNLDDINDIYMSEYGESKGEAEKEAAINQLKSFPMEIDDDETFIFLDKILPYIYNYDLKNIETFDQFLDIIGENNELSADKISEEGYNHMDLTELNRVVGNKLDDIIDGFNDENSEYFSYIKGYQELQAYISQFKFVNNNEKGIIATHQQPDKTINIIEFKYDVEDNELSLKIDLIYKDGKKRTGWILAKNLRNYIGQPEIQSMRENKNGR
jgi:hypothetical protein